MRKALIILCFLLATPVAQAQQAVVPYQISIPSGFVLNNSSYILAGPGADYPRIALVYSSRYFDMHSCLSDWSWCEVSAGIGIRGWLPGDQIYLKDLGSVRQFGPKVGIPFNVFNQSEYWNTHYRNTVFYTNWINGKAHINSPARGSGNYYTNAPRPLPLPIPQPIPQPQPTPPVVQPPIVQPQPVLPPVEQRTREKQNEIKAKIEQPAETQLDQLTKQRQNEIRAKIEPPASRLGQSVKQKQQEIRNNLNRR